ncbi:hypothetical protein [Cetobacterium sp.]|nr:hypothetical protein [uncultured Cetobacterium sp.]
MKNKFFIVLVLTVISIKVESEKGFLKKYVRVSNFETKTDFKVLLIERGF